MEDKELNQLLKNALLTDYEPDHNLNTKILQKIRENQNMNGKKMRRLSVAAVVCCAVLCGSVTAFAAWTLLTPKEIATEYGDKQLATAFESKDAVSMQESKTYGKYTVTLLGAVSGKNLSDVCSEEEQLSPEKTYAVVAIANKDGSPMPKTSDETYGEEAFFVSPLIQGLNPAEYNIITMHGGYSEIVRDGIKYRIIECDNVELFADKALYMCVSNTTFLDRDAYTFDEKTGTISANKDYEGMNLLFDLPLKKEKANKDAAKQYLKKLTLEEENEKNSKEEEDKEFTKPDINEVQKNWTLVSEEKVTPDKDGRVYYSHKGKSGSGEGFITEDALFDEGETGYSETMSGTQSNDWKTAVLFYKDKAGDILVSVYETHI
ncbi:hypothetical protein [Sinanaerobacter sp. ZZT-01]|uniref:hypothetical protein n=1 Tax=Sinanaerobacter sp. ZZT-01 TaxID=3111540 RepID=UPI002D773E53|nr:hypothetical protein [Sinanaerobacter sp. ZZT-01]WRR92162.1 hypothetical protein U5921_08755 [Sinanaerobacter sp. ZZT-01]